MRKSLLAGLFFLVLPFTAFADTEGPQFPYTAETNDKKHIFVIVKPDCERCWGSDRYRQSGMYLNDGSTTPLWTVDWNNYIFLPNGGKFVIRKGRWARYSATYREEAFSFIAEGRIVKTYETRDLVDFPYLLPHSSSHYRALNSLFNSDSPPDGVVMKIDNGSGYPANVGAQFDAENQTLQLEALHGDKYLFDLKTGNIIASEHPSRKTGSLLFGVLVTGFAAYLFLARKLKPRGFILKAVNYGTGFVLTLCLLLIPVITVSVHQTGRDEVPEFWWLCFASVSMLPKYLFTSLNLISPPENNMLDISLETTFMWFLIFWLPCALFAGLATNFIVKKIKPLR